MPDTYTREQIDEAKLWLTTNDTGDSPSQKRRIGFEAIVLSALDTAERERDEAQGIADQMCDEFQRIKIHMAGRDAEIAALCDRAMLKLKQTVPIIARAEKSDAERDALRAQVAELEARL